MVWETLDEDGFDPLEWGWSAEDGLQPVKTDKPVAPSELLNFIRCKCKSGCTSKLCSCRKHGLVCVAACKNCRGDCKNAEVRYQYYYYVYLLKTSFICVCYTIIVMFSSIIICLSFILYSTRYLTKKLRAISMTGEI